MYTIILCILTFQSALPRGERLTSLANCTPLQAISIRAPARGATRSKALEQFFHNFNPRSREGSDGNREETFFVECYFNPRSREGSDGDFNCIYGCKLISIRAPARGATITEPVFHMHFTFQSALPRGERPLLNAPVIPFVIFQSALPRGERRRLDQYGLLYKSISIRAPARGATPTEYN